jgi:NAD(P)H dehydrogenase, quinone family
LLKGYIDRVFIPGFAYAYDENVKHSNYLKGKTMCVFSTCDADANTVTNTYKNADFIIFNDNMCHFLGMQMKQMIRVDTLYAKNESERKKIIEEIVSKIE